MKNGQFECERCGDLSSKDHQKWVGDDPARFGPICYQCYHNHTTSPTSKLNLLALVFKMEKQLSKKIKEDKENEESGRF